MEAATASAREVVVPDIGDFSDVPIIEVLVSPGDVVAAEDPLVTLESDKATMDVPAPFGGVVAELKVQVGDKVSEGSPLLTLRDEGTDPETATEALVAPAEDDASATEAEVAGQPTPPPAGPAAGEPASSPPPVPADTAPAPGPARVDESPAPAEASSAGDRASVHASPSVRRLARELGVDLAEVRATGPKGRLTKDDLLAHLRGGAGAPAAAPSPDGAGLGFGLPPWPRVDFEKFGPVEREPLPRIKRISGPALHRNWLTIPHVTHDDEADVTELEAFRQETNEAVAKRGLKVTMLAFLLKASVAALQEFPRFNASLDGDELVLKRYYHLGFAADTPNGLVVPVIRDVDRKGVLEISEELRDLSAKAREGTLAPGEMQGGTFSISSLGGIGGTHFTPIVNAPEVAILGVSRMVTKPVWRDGAFVPRLILPLSLSYDHRIIDGAEGARFAAHLARLVSDMRRVLL